MHGPWQDGESQVLVVIPPGALADPTLITQFCIRCIF